MTYCKILCWLQNIIHDWDDDRNIKILVNCYNALPSSGKVIMIDALLPTHTPAEESLDDLCAFEADITMLAVSTCGRERDETEWQNLATKSGFTDVRFVKLDYMYVIEATKAWLKRCSFTSLLPSLSHQS